MPETRARYTDDQILDAMAAALTAGDYEAVVALLHILAVQAPDKAEAIYDAITKRVIRVPVELGDFAAITR